MIKPDTSKKFYKWEVVILLWIAFFLNQADRQAFNIVIPHIQSIYNLHDSEMGLIAMLFNIFYAITVPFAGYYADRLSRSRQIMVSTLIFSSATFLTGLSGGIFCFILFRCAGMGIGQGMFGPTYMGLIAQYHDNTTRARALSLHQTSSYLGVICCGLLTGLIADSLGWQYSFYIFGALGILFTTVLILRLRDRNDNSINDHTPIKEYPTINKHATINKEVAEKSLFMESVSAFFRVPTAVCILIAFSGGLFVITGYLTWMPKLLKETFDLSTASAGFHSMFWASAASFIGVMTGGYLNDKLVLKNKRHGADRLFIEAMSLILASPFIIIMGYSRCLPLVCFALSCFGFFRGIFESCSFPILYDVISYRYYSTSSGIMILFGFSFGALAPWILGMIGDHFGLSAGISLLGIVWILVSISLIVARYKYYEKDFEKLNITAIN